MKVLTIGGATYDIFIHYTGMQTTTVDQQCFVLLQEGCKVDVESIEYHSGGGATNSAVSFARLGFDTHSFFKIGADLQGTSILDTLHQEGVITHPLLTNAHQTSCSFILPCPSGDRTVLVYRGASNWLTQEEIPTDLIAQHDYIYVTSLGGNSAALLPHIARTAKQHGVSVAVNPGTSQINADVHSLMKALPFIDIFILNRHEAYHCMQALDASLNFDIATFCRLIMAQGPRIVAVTDGAQGVYVAQENRLLFHPSISVTVVSSVGAGDAFGSCFVAQIAQNKSIDYAIRAGIINSASVIGHVGAKTGLLDQETIKRQMQDLEKSLLKSLQ